MTAMTANTGSFAGMLLHNTGLNGRYGPSKPEGDHMTILKPVLMTIAACFAMLASAACAKPSLRDVPEIENTLFAVALADEIRDNCSSLSGRYLKGFGVLRRLRSRANALGYSDAEIRAYVESDAEKARMRTKGHKFLAAQGVDYNNPETFCAFGRAEIAKSSAIGVLLKAN